MDGYIRSEREEFFEQLCISVDADEAHEQEAIEFFENQFDQADFDPAQWLDIALYYSPAVARGIVDMVTPDDKARSNIAEVIADNLDISYGEDECQQFAETLAIRAEQRRAGRPRPRARRLPARDRRSRHLGRRRNQGAAAASARRVAAPARRAVTRLIVASIVASVADRSLDPSIDARG